MKNTSSPLTPKADRPVDPITVAIGREILQAATTLDIPLLLVGATTRIILLEHVLGHNPGRATRDVDFAFALQNWEQFNAIKQHLVGTGKFKISERAAQRLFYLPDIERSYIVDLIPFGDIETPSSTIAWPPEGSIVMNVAGYRDALAAAVLVEISPGLTIPVASLPGIAILKLFAWSDRGREDPKDAIDFALLLRNYHQADNLDRIYENAIPALEAAGYDIELAGAWLLGQDAYAMTTDQTRTELLPLLKNEKNRQRLIEDMARGMIGRDDALDYTNTLLHHFSVGFTV